MGFPRYPALAFAAAIALHLVCTTAAAAAEPSAEDLAVIEALQDQGVDLTQPQLVEFLVSFQSVQPARTVGKTLAAEGFKSAIDTGGGGRDVLLLARKQVVLNAADMGALRVRLESLAKSAGGQYEGWGIP
jgi:hypothetical protein